MAAIGWSEPRRCWPRCFTPPPLNGGGIRRVVQWVHRRDMRHAARGALGGSRAPTWPATSCAGLAAHRCPGTVGDLVDDGRRAGRLPLGPGAGRGRRSQPRPDPAGRHDRHRLPVRAGPPPGPGGAAGRRLPRAGPGRGIRRLRRRGHGSPGQRAAGRRSPSTRWPISPRCPTCRPWSPRAVAKVCRSSPACRTCHRLGSAGATRPKGSCRSSASRSSCPASATCARWSWYPSWAVRSTFRCGR